MPPTLALAIWLVLLLALLYFDPAKEPRTSLALWVPLTWIVIVGSRLPSQWFGSHSGAALEAIQEGSPVDRAIFSVLILLAIVTLIARSFSWGGFIARNFALTVFLFFALLSVLWSDFPLIALKRWFRDLGTYIVILVVVSDPRPLEALRTVFRRASYLLIPLSIVLIKYYRQIGVGYETWTGQTMYQGVTIGKNRLGAVCLVGALFFFWDITSRWARRREGRTKRIIAVDLVFLVMNFWLLHISHSATSEVCFLIGCFIVVLARSKFSQRHPGFLKAFVPLSFILYLAAVGLGLNGELVRAVGRDPTLTTRTYLWQLLLGMKTNPVVGTGYESFWLGNRLQYVWQQFNGPDVNEAHNGYLEVYLNLGLVGLSLLVIFLIAGYRAICKRIANFPDFASLALALWGIAVFYNVTEAAFKFHWIWITLLPVVIVTPEWTDKREPSVATSDSQRGVEISAGTGFEVEDRQTW